jgi:hypothetical protein
LGADKLSVVEDGEKAAMGERQKNLANDRGFSGKGYIRKEANR